MKPEDEAVRGLPKDLMQDIKRAAYEAKVRAMEDEARRRARSDSADADVEARSE